MIIVRNPQNSIGNYLGPYIKPAQGRLDAFGGLWPQALHGTLQHQLHKVLYKRVGLGVWGLGFRVEGLGFRV